MIRRFIIGALAIGLAACGGNTTSTPGTSTAQLEAYQAVGQGLTTALRTYTAQAASTTSVTDCQAAQGAYDAAAAPLVAAMQHQSHAMDDHMAGTGDHHADLGCVAEAMAAELAHHRAEACSGADPAAHHAEAAHHVDTMAQWLDHQRVRYEDLAAASGMMQAHTEATFTCQAGTDGTYTFTQGGTTTHYPDPEHSGGTTPTGTGGSTAPGGGPACPGDWPGVCHDGSCPGGMTGMH